MNICKHCLIKNDKHDPAVPFIYLPRYAELDCVERLTVGITCILTIVFLLGYINGILPKVRELS